MAARTWLMLAMLCHAGSVWGQELPGDRAAGQRLAESWCGECHDVAPGPYDPAWLYAPPFQVVADDPAATETSLRVFLRTPHQAMPDVRLTPKQSDDLISYILSLKRDAPR